MTKGKIVLITDKQVLTSTEFECDMYYEYHGKGIIAKLKDVHTEKDFEDFVKRFNDENFEYNEELIYDAQYVEVLKNGQYETEYLPEEELFDFSVRYFDKWFSDYVYIKNLRRKSVDMTDSEGQGLALLSDGILMLNFGEYTDECREYSLRVDRTISRKAIGICEKLGWTLNIGTTDVELEKYSPAGEDFIFTVSIDNFISDVIEYASDFDADEHAEMWVESRGKNGVPSSIRTLIDDADDIDKMLQELSDTLGKSRE